MCRTQYLESLLFHPSRNIILQNTYIEKSNIFKSINMNMKGHAALGRLHFSAKGRAVTIPANTTAGLGFTRSQKKGGLGGTKTTEVCKQTIRTHLPPLKESGNMIKYFT